MGREPLGPPADGPPPGPPPGAPDEPGGPDWPLRVEDQIRKLKQLAAVLGLLATIALGVALWALLSEDESDGSGLSRERVSRINERIQELEDRVENQDTGQLERELEDKADNEDIESLRNEVEELGGRVEDADSGQAVDQLSQRIDELEQQINDLEQQQDEQQQEP